MTSRALSVLAVAALALLGSIAGAALAGGAVAGGTDGGRFAHHPTPDGDEAPETTLVENGSVVNANANTAPAGCSEIRGERHVTIEAGEEFAAPGEAFGYDLDRISAPPCTRLVVTLVNHDDVRHQWMVHGLPTETYPWGMFTIEVANQGRVTGSFVTPAQSGEYTGHCSLPQHAQKGMRLPLVITGEVGNRSTPTTVTDAGESGGSMPGFGTGVALLAGAAGAVLAARRHG